MPRCPRCGEMTYYLVAYFEAEARFKAVPDGTGGIEYIFDEYIDESIGDVIEFGCPECSAVICTDEEVAAAFLRGEKIIPVEEPVLVSTEGQDRSWTEPGYYWFGGDHLR